ncbi:hypothetical protein AMTRI_Chr03g140760 [Amborella trichopoda]
MSSDACSVSAPRESGTTAATCGVRVIGKRCVRIVKQHRTRLYILRRCITMLLCWHTHSVRE